MIHHGNNIEVLKGFKDNSIDSIVTDPPYGLSFMNKHWDYDVPSIELWKECFRVLKHGGHLLSFAGTRTYHRMTVRIEDAGFEIRDMISWIYGSGFPKSLDISKAIDKQKGTFESDLVPTKNGNTKGSRGNTYATDTHAGFRNIAEAQSPEAIQWNGWGTALKPACEPICVARKPLIGTVANNVLEYGTGGLNIDGCRIGTKDNLTIHGSKVSSNIFSQVKPCEQFQTAGQQLGRFPANIIFDEISSILLDEQSGESNGGSREKKIAGFSGGSDTLYKSGHKPINTPNYTDKGGASRFFYCAKASKSERNGGLEGFEEKENMRVNAPRENEEEKTANKMSNFHPTVKPLKLMQYLVRLVTPPNGTCLDPFCGSGTTLMACVKEGFNYIGIEREADYVKIAEARVEWIKKQKSEIPEQTDLFKKVI